MPSCELGPRGRRHGRHRHVEKRIGIRPKMQPCISQIPTMVLECHRLISCQQPHDDVKALLEELTRLGLRDPDHDAVRRQRAWSGTEHRAPAGQVIE